MGNAIYLSGDCDGCAVYLGTPPRYHRDYGGQGVRLLGPRYGRAVLTALGVQPEMHGGAGGASLGDGSPRAAHLWSDAIAPTVPLLAALAAAAAEASADYRSGLSWVSDTASVAVAAATAYELAGGRLPDTGPEVWRDGRRWRLVRAPDRWTWEELEASGG